MTNNMTSLKNRYQRAEQLLAWNLTPKLKNRTVQPHWLDAHRFWFRRDTQDGHEFVLVDSDKRTEKTIDICKEGDIVKVKVIGFDDRGKVKLSMKRVDQETGADLEAAASAEAAAETAE